MIWGIGLPKSGTTSLAAQYNLVHEPAPRMLQEHHAYYYSRNIKAVRQLLEIYYQGVTTGYSEWRTVEGRLYGDHEWDGACDGKYLTLVPAIREVDKDARIICVYREPIDWMESNLTRKYESGQFYNCLKPKTHKDVDIKRYVNLYGMINALAYDYMLSYRDVLEQEDIEFIHVADLAEKKNKGPHTFKFTEEEHTSILQAYPELEEVWEELSSR